MKLLSCNLELFKFADDQRIWGCEGLRELCCQFTLMEEESPGVEPEKSVRTFALTSVLGPASAECPCKNGLSITMWEHGRQQPGLCLCWSPEMGLQDAAFSGQLWSGLPEGPGIFNLFLAHATASSVQNFWNTNWGFSTHLAVLLLSLSTS